MKDIMLAEMPMDQRAQVLRDSCDQICEISYTKKFSSAEINQRRAEVCDVANQINTLEQQHAEIKAELKGKIKPLQERMGSLLDEIKAGGQYVTGDCFKFVDIEEGKAAFYDDYGYKVDERDITPEERQRNVFQMIRKTGTED